MVGGAAVVVGAKTAASARIEELRRAVEGTVDRSIRAHLRVQLSDLLRARADSGDALAELLLAAREAPGLPGVRLALLSAAAEMPVSKRSRFLAQLVEDDTAADGGPIPAWSDAAASARAESGAVDDAIAAWLALAADTRSPLYRRRAAARQAEAMAKDRAPAQRLAALRLHAGLTGGRTRLSLLRRAIGVARGTKDRAALLGLAADWLDVGGEAPSAAALVKQAWAAGAPAADIARLEAEISRRLGDGGAGAGLATPTRPVDATSPPEARRSTPVSRRSPSELLDDALVAARSGQPGRARRLAERVLRRGAEGRRYGGGDSASDADLAAGLAAVEGALRQSGALREALLLRRTQLEGEPDATRAGALTELAADADAAGLGTLARNWRADAAQTAPPLPAPALPEPTSPREHYLAAQRWFARLPADAPVEPILTMLAKAAAGHPAADDALALAERLLARAVPPDAAATPGAGAVDPRFVELLRAASSYETELPRRARIAERLADALERQQDPIGAVAVLQRALQDLPRQMGASLRRRRARLLRQLGRLRELGEALDSDVVALEGEARLAAYTERAALLDGAGEPERALEVRLQALVDYPSDRNLLSLARRRLESTGRPEPSLRLAVAALTALSDSRERLALLRDIAVLSEKAARNLTDAAMAWLSVLEIDPDDLEAMDAAERLLLASGQPERCAELLAWAAARAVGPSLGGAAAADPRLQDPGRHAALLWRLAELRRRLRQEEEALRLYLELGRLLHKGALDADPSEVGRRRVQPGPGRRSAQAQALHTARVAVAPTDADRSRALLDRGLHLLDQAGRQAEAEADFVRALDLDPRNVDVIIALERVTERTGRWQELAADFREKAAGVVPSAAARLWFGAGRASERLRDPAAARDAYQRAVALDPALRQPLSALARLAMGRGEWIEATRLLEAEIALCNLPGDRARVSADLAGVVGEQLQQPERALELLQASASLFPDDPVTLERLYRFNLAAGGSRWEQAGQVLDRWTAGTAAIADVADKYFDVGAAAEADGRPERALAFYSRAYARNNGHRPALERLSEICFDREQWENAWKATEALLERHRAALPRRRLAALLLRSVLCDIHVAQRAGAMAKLLPMMTSGGRFVSEAGLRDVAESWSAMRLEPRLLVGLDGERRARVLKRTAEALSLVESEVCEDRVTARQLLAALAISDRRWTDALVFLDALANDGACDDRQRCGYLIAAGDIHLREAEDAEAAQRLYGRARQLAPGDVRLLSRREPSAATPTPPRR